MVILSPKDLNVSKGGDVTITNQIYGNKVFSSNFNSINRVMLTENKYEFLPEGYFAVLKPYFSIVKLFIRFILSYQHPIFARFENIDMERKLIELDPDVIFAEHLYMVPSAKYKFNYGSRKVIVASVHVLESAIQRGLKKSLSHSLKQSELEALTRINLAVTFNSKEVNLISSYMPELEVICIKPYFPKGIKTDFTGNFLFVGNQTWSPNRECVEEIHEIWRTLNAKKMEYKIDIVGLPPKRPYINIPDGVIHHGFVDNLDYFYRRAVGLVAPIKTGGGVRIKILEAISHGIPIVTTSPGLDDLDEISDFVNLGKEKNDFVELISRLANDEDERLRQSNAIYSVSDSLNNKSMSQWQNLVEKIKFTLDQKQI
jgi:glycosyltransferase involved in cell wall biosynthesis